MKTKVKIIIVNLISYSGKDSEFIRLEEETHMTNAIFVSGSYKNVYYKIPINNISYIHTSEEEREPHGTSCSV